MAPEKASVPVFSMREGSREETKISEMFYMFFSA